MWNFSEEFGRTFGAKATELQSPQGSGLFVQIKSQHGKCTLRKKNAEAADEIKEETGQQGQATWSLMGFQ